MATFYATIKDEITGITILEDFEVEIVGHADGYGLVIEDVRTEGKSMFKGDAISQALAAKIANQAEDDDELHEHFGVRRYDPCAEHGTYNVYRGRVA